MLVSALKALQSCYYGHMTERVCQHCSEPMPIIARRHARYCTGKCRVAAHRSRALIPSELTDRPRWVRHTEAKVPITPSGKPASSTDARTWSSFAAVRASGSGVGTGFVLNGDGLAVVDLDDCIHQGRIAAWAQEILDEVPETYIEISPSGRGLHIWGKGYVPRGRVIRDGMRKIEIYGAGRYITVTGKRYGIGRQLADIQNVIDREVPDGTRNNARAQAGGQSPTAQRLYAR